MELGYKEMVNSAGKNESYFGEMINGVYNGNGCLRIFQDDGIIEEYSGIFTCGEIIKGVYRRLNSKKLLRYNEAVEEFNRNMKIDNAQGYIWYWTNSSGPFEYALEVEEIKPLEEFVDFEYYGQFVNKVPNGKNSVLIIRIIAVRDSIKKKKMECNQGETNEYREAFKYPVVFAQSINIPIINFGVFEKGTIMQYHESEGKFYDDDRRSTIIPKFDLKNMNKLRFSEGEVIFDWIKDK